MTTINGVINKVSPLKSPIVVNGGKTRTVNGLRHVDYDKWRLNWNGNHFAPPSLSSVLWLPGVPGVGATIFDHSGSSNNGTISEALWKQLPTGLWYLDFDGVDDDVVVAHATSINLDTNFTVKAWINPDDWLSDDYNAVVSRAGTGADVNKGFSFEGTNAALTIVLWVGDGTDQLGCTSASDISAGVWTQVGGTWDGTNINVFINGTADGTPQAQSAPAQYTSDLKIGDHSSETGVQRQFNGGIALVELINGVAWTAANFASCYNQERHLFGV